MLSRISLDRLLNIIDSSDISKDEKTEAVHGLIEQLQTSCLLETSYAARRGGKYRMREASVNGDLI